MNTVRWKVTSELYRPAEWVYLASCKRLLSTWGEKDEYVDEGLFHFIPTQRLPIAISDDMLARVISVAVDCELAHVRKVLNAVELE